MPLGAEILASSTDTINNISKAVPGDRATSPADVGQQAAQTELLTAGTRALAALSGHNLPAQFQAWAEEAHGARRIHALRNTGGSPHLLAHVCRSLWHVV